ncbi:MULTISPECIES: phage portal protein [unclassified Acinetobacter]|uniref:phage portal protein n=1 Tax=unclassified Acinetobacter TaxID=196816 RepID=UPI00124FF1A9|nr:MULTISPECIES: phage portal protein [unclassified Acinetobacter]
MGAFSKFFRKKSMSPVQGSGGWSGVFEPFMGAWQRNMELKKGDLLEFHPIFSCISLISKDIGKMPLELKKKKGEIWVKTKDDRLKFLEKPNNFQTMQQFLEYWIISKLSRGNTYVLKFRNFLGQIEQLIVLNPDLVKPLVDSSGNVFYQISIDLLAKQTQSVILPASEIIHDRWNCLYHPLVGLSPVVALTATASSGLAIQNYSANFFNNMSRPSGILTAPGRISDEDARDIQKRWKENYSGSNVGGTAVLGSDMKYLSISIAAADAQLIEQHKFSVEVSCSAFNMPPYKIGFGSFPQGMKVEDVNILYYGDCLQSPTEAIENLLDDGLGLKAMGYEVFLDVESLIRMDSASKMDFYTKGVKGGIIAPNEARIKFNLEPVAGGWSVYMQQQNFSLEALSKRDAKDDPFASSKGGKDAPNSE